MSDFLSQLIEQVVDAMQVHVAGYVCSKQSYTVHTSVKATIMAPKFLYSYTYAS